MMATGKLFALVKKFPETKNFNQIRLFIWTIGIVVLTTCAILDFLPLLHDYKDDNVATKIAVIKEQTLRPSNMSICLPFYSSSLSSIAEWLFHQNQLNSTTTCIECEEMKNHAWDIWNSIEFENFSNSSSKGDYENKLALTLVKKLLQEKNGFDILRLNYSNFNWNQLILDAAWKYLACLSRQDIMCITDEIELSSLWNQCLDFDPSAVGWIENEVIDQILEFLIECENISSHQSEKSLVFRFDQANWRHICRAHSWSILRRNE